MPRDSNPPRAGEHARLDQLLAVWVEYQRSGGTKHLRTETSRFWAHGASDFGSMIVAADIRDAEVVDAIVWSLPPAERSAILHRHLAAVWRFAREDVETVYQRARAALSAALVRRGVP